MANNDFLSFRSQINGYNKSDVNAFIEEQNIRFSSSEASFRKTIEEKQEQIKALTKKLDELGVDDDSFVMSNDEKKKLDESIKTKDAKIKSLEADLRKYKDSKESTNLKEKLEKKEEEIKELKAELKDCNAKLNKKITEQVEEAKTVAVSNDNAQMYDKLSKQLGSMLIDAREVADHTIEEAKKEAERIINEAQENANATMASVVEKKDAELDIIKRALKRLSSDISCEYLKYISDSRESFEKLLAENSSKQTQLLTELNELYVKTQSVIDVEIKTIDPNF